MPTNTRKRSRKPNPLEETLAAVLAKVDALDKRAVDASARAAAIECDLRELRESMRGLRESTRGRGTNIGDWTCSRIVAGAGGGGGSGTGVVTGGRIIGGSGGGVGGGVSTASAPPPPDATASTSSERRVLLALRAIAALARVSELPEGQTHDDVLRGVSRGAQGSLDRAITLWRQATRLDVSWAWSGSRSWWSVKSDAAATVVSITVGPMTIYRVDMQRWKARCERGEIIDPGDLALASRLTHAVRASVLETGYDDGAPVP